MMKLFILFLLCTVWSFFLRMIAFTVTQEHHQRSIKTLRFKIMDGAAAVWWLYIITHYQTFFPAYFLFFSALWISVYTDAEHMLISRFFSLYLVPVGIACSMLGLLPLHPLESSTAAAFGYALLWVTNKIFRFFKKCDGLGQGDMDLMACIGAFLGFWGCWCTLVISSLVGSVFGLVCMLVTKKQIKALPFGPFLALGASTFIIFNSLFDNFA
jgi:leader peptidase (prepilin peptidase)/N-methyltransferase